MKEDEEEEDTETRAMGGSTTNARMLDCVESRILK